DVDAEERKDGAGPVQRPGAIATRDRRQDRDDDRRERDEQRAVGHARTGETADEQILIQAVADQAEPGQPQPVAARDWRRRVEDIVSERAPASEPRERSAPAKRRARERVGESEGRSPLERTGAARDVAGRR